VTQLEVFQSEVTRLEAAVLQSEGEVFQSAAYRLETVSREQENKS
jgi:hypothetical protein